MAGIYSIGGSAGHRYAGWLSEVEAKNFTFGGKVFNGSPSAIYVGSNRVWMPGGWLESAAVRAILAAFGQTDGWAVIKATNAYLNQLAASDRDKATALAGFINEDPMMVCSLGLQPQGVTMPIRYIYGYNGGYAKTGYYYQNTDSIKIRCKYPRVSEDKKFFGSRGNGFGLCVISSVWRPLINGIFYTVGSLVTGRIYDIEFKQTASNTVFSDGTYSATYGRMNTASAECFIFGLNNGGGSVEGQTPNFQMISAELGDSRKYIPFTRDGNLELIDLVNGVLATRVGTFKEFYELPDGTPWTPSTP